MTLATQSKAQYKTVSVVEKKSDNHLYYDGILKPLKTTDVLSPVDGRVTKMYFEYGEYVKKGKILIRISSSQLATSFQQALEAYLKAKDAYINGQKTFTGTKVLNKYGLISRNEYMSAESQYNSNVLSYEDAKNKLKNIIKKTDLDFGEVQSLSLNDINQINDLLKIKFNDIKVFAPSNGVVLYPTFQQAGNSDKDDQDSGKIVIGKAIKNNQLLVTIGDLNGYSMKISVNEVSINRIKPDYKVKVTGDGFPGIKLNGFVATVSSQANQNDNQSSQSEFDVVINIPSISDIARKTIKVGMSAHVDIHIPNALELYVPINAIITQNGATYVKKVMSDGKTTLVPVITGETTLNSVAIVRGLKSGDKILVPVK